MPAKSSYSCLPEGYAEAFKINIQTDKKLALIINGLALIIMLACLLAGYIISPYGLYDLFADIAAGAWWGPILECAALLAAIMGYMVLHELVHGITMLHYGATRVRYGFTGMYAYAGSEDDYFAKKPYIVIALAPIVVWGAVLLIINLLVPANWFWFVYLIQVTNLSGAAGDLYVVWRFSKLPADILVKDTGYEMTVYSKQ